MREADPDYEISAHSWPRFLYSRGEFDLDDEEKGLLQGELLVKACCFLDFVFCISLISLTGI